MSSSCRRNSRRGQQKKIMRDTMMEPIIMTILPDDSDWSDEEDTDEEKYK